MGTERRAETDAARVLRAARAASCARQSWPQPVMDWSGVDLTPKSTPYAKKLMELQDSNAAPDQIYTIKGKSWH